MPPPYAIRVKTATGWQDIAIQGATGPPGPAGPAGPAIGTFRFGQTFAVPGPLTNGALPPLFVPVVAGQTMTLKGVRARLGSGTSVAAQVTRNGVNLGSAITVTTTAATTAFSQALVADDALGFVLGSLAGSPADLSATFYLESVT